MRRVILSGQYCHDLAERFSFTGIDPAKITVIPAIPEAAAALESGAEKGDEALYVVTCFSDRDKLLDLPCVRKEAL